MLDVTLMSYYGDHCHEGPVQGNNHTTTQISAEHLSKLTEYLSDGFGPSGARNKLIQNAIDSGLSPAVIAETFPSIQQVYINIHR